MPTLTILSEHARLRGFRYFWMKSVTAFNPSTHCARCLVGDYESKIGAAMHTGIKVDLDYREGTILYLCGVSVPYRWVNNLHLPMRVKAGVEFFADTYLGERIVVQGAELLTFDDRAARELHPQRGKEFLTCRNFQFGAHHFRG
jgi:hypothetical protein